MKKVILGRKGSHKSQIYIDKKKLYIFDFFSKEKIDFLHYYSLGAKGRPIDPANPFLTSNDGVTMGGCVVLERF